MTITPKDWCSFQHYKQRRPPWIKLHRTLLDNSDYQRLHVASRALAPMLWLVAAEYDDGKITCSIEDIAWRLRMPINEFIDALKPLIENGFFECEQDASKLLARCKQKSMPETETETETETHSRSKAKAIRPSESRFDEFWKSYPRRDGPNPRKPAEDKFNALVKTGCDPQVIIDAVKALASEETRRGNIGTRFIPQATTWLNQQRWSDHAAIAVLAQISSEAVLSKKFHVKADTAQWAAWTKHLGKPPPIDKNFGWYFDSEWPPMSENPNSNGEQPS